MCLKKLRKEFSHYARISTVYVAFVEFIASCVGVAGVAILYEIMKACRQIWIDVLYQPTVDSTSNAIQVRGSSFYIWECNNKKEKKRSVLIFARGSFLRISFSRMYFSHI